MGLKQSSLPQTPRLQLEGVTCTFGDVQAVNDLSLEVQAGEILCLLGPSGCGKTTLLRMIAGFEETNEGSILLFGEQIASLPPDRRPVNTVFQQYALFPHMTVAENVAFGLRMLKRPKAEIMETTARMLDLVKLGDYGTRRPSQLSGGQQQRVALARAMAPGPKVLLLDEPLSALDLKLRQEMRVELKQLQRETGITFVFVTHDQEEALTMSDRIAVMSEGEVQQIGTAEEIYEAPNNRFVADFIGETNLIDVTVESIGDICTCRLGNGAAIDAIPAGVTRKGSKGHLSIRPERIALTDRPDTAPLSGTIEHAVYLGTDTQHMIRLDDGTLVTARTQNAHRAALTVAKGDRVGLVPDEGAARLLVD